MAFTPTTPVTGAAVSGLTSPTYTLTQDTQPTLHSKQYYVSALGGTQTGVDAHTIARPFTVAMFRPAVLKIASWFSTMTGFKKPNQRNTFKVIGRKGVTPVAGAPSEVAHISIVIDLPAGSDTVDMVNVKALLSMTFGVAWANATGISDTISSGSL